jgi:putative serine protease PepD
MTQQPPPPFPEPVEGTPAEGTPPTGAAPQGPPMPAPQPWSSQPPRDSSQTAPLWYEQTQTQMHYPAYPPVASPTPEPTSVSPTAPLARQSRSARTRRLATASAIALVAAVLASTGTYALTRNDVTTASPVSQTTAIAATSASPVLQASASAPNWSVTAGVVSPSVVSITVTGSQATGQGSGVIFDTSGHILTNNHVVTAGGSGSTISVTLADERTYAATVVGTDPSTDLAVIKLTNGPSDLKPISLGNSDSLKVGDQVMAVGNPLGLAGTVTTGIVSALNRPVTTSDQSTDPTAQTADPVVSNAIQTSAAINPGNSGGALVNANGQLIGINSAIASLDSSDDPSSQSGNIGIGFAIPVNEARSIADQLISTGKATHPYLGVSSKDGQVTDGAATRPGAVLTSVVSGTPAAKAGLQTNDAIIAVNGNPIDGSLSLLAQVRQYNVGTKVTIEFLRGSQSHTVTVTLIALPAGL